MFPPKTSQESDSSRSVRVVCLFSSTQYLLKSMLHHQNWCFIFWWSYIVWQKRGIQGICHLLISSVASAWLTCDVGVSLVLRCSCVINKTRQVTAQDLMNEWGWDWGGKEAFGPAVFVCVSACVRACVRVCVCMYVCVHECLCVRSQKFRFNDQVSSWSYKNDFHIFSFPPGNNWSFDLFLVNCSHENKK